MIRTIAKLNKDYSILIKNGGMEAPTTLGVIYEKQKTRHLQILRRDYVHERHDSIFKIRKKII